MPLLTMSLLTCIVCACDGYHFIVLCHFYWLTDAMLSYVTFAHLAHCASHLCQFPAHYATSLGEAWPPFAAGIFAFVGDVNHFRITSNLDWPADTVLNFMNCDRQMQGPFLSCHYAA